MALGSLLFTVFCFSSVNLTRASDGSLFTAWRRGLFPISAPVKQPLDVTSRKDTSSTRVPPAKSTAVLAMKPTLQPISARRGSKSVVRADYSAHGHGPPYGEYREDPLKDRNRAFLEWPVCLGVGKCTHKGAFKGYTCRVEQNRTPRKELRGTSRAMGKACECYDPDSCHPLALESLEKCRCPSKAAVSFDVAASGEMLTFKIQMKEYQPERALVIEHLIDAAAANGGNKR